MAKGNNVLSQMTVMNLPSICPALPLTIETAANKAELAVVAWVLLTAVQLYASLVADWPQGLTHYPEQWELSHRMLAYAWAV